MIKNVLNCLLELIVQNFSTLDIQLSHYQSLSVAVYEQDERWNFIPDCKQTYNVTL